MTASPPVSPETRRNRRTLILLVVLFFGAMLAAGALRFSGWRPDGMKNKGEMLSPYGDLRAYSPTLVSGAAYHWDANPRTWRIVVVPRDCDAVRRAACTELLGSLDKVWRLMGRHADRVHVLWAGAPPVSLVGLREVHLIRDDAGLRAGLTGLDASAGQGDAAWLVDPNGFVVLRYGPGFDPADLRSDLGRLLRIN